MDQGAWSDFVTSERPSACSVRIFHARLERTRSSRSDLIRLTRIERGPTHVSA